MPIFLNALELSFYRGIGDEAQIMYPFKEFNFFIGANNSGKSTVLSFIHDHLSEVPSRALSILTSLETYRGKKTGMLAFSVGIPENDFRSRVHEVTGGEPFKSMGDLVMNQLILDGMVWVKRASENPSRFAYSFEPSLPQIEAALREPDWRNLWHRLTGQSGGSLQHHWIPETVQRMLTLQPFSLPKVRLIPSFRQLGPKGSGFNDLSGTGLIDRLSEIQSPDHDKREERRYFDKINKFLQDVTGKPDASIEVPHHRDHLLVHMDNKVLPLTSLGMGIHEVILIAAFCTLTESQIVCMEEPEIHLHPLLQRKLISYLRTNTNNQYFIATHSASFIDTPGAAIFHVSNDGDQTRIRETVLRADRQALCMDLGYKASDIVQANAVIWVEGPSDRTYINHWLSAARPDLIEGIHYSIMFYGGRLLSHLTADSDEIGEFIALRSLNQHLAMVMDSDKTSASDAINETKARLRGEFQKGEGYCWITQGREIENYIDHVLLQDAVQRIYPKLYDKAAAGGIFDHALFFSRNKPKKISDPDADPFLETAIDKVAVAKLVSQAAAQLDILDLHERVNGLVVMIDRANR